MRKEQKRKSWRGFTVNKAAFMTLALKTLDHLEDGSGYDRETDMAFVGGAELSKGEKQVLALLAHRITCLVPTECEEVGGLNPAKDYGCVPNSRWLGGAWRWEGTK